MARLPSCWRVQLSGLRLMDLLGCWDAIAWRYQGLFSLGLRGRQQSAVTVNSLGLHGRLSKASGG
jgi:hypothetical protein